MKRMLTLKILRKFMILSCLVIGVLFAASNNSVQAGSDPQCVTCEQMTVGLGGHQVNLLIGPNSDYTDCVYNSYWVEEPQYQPQSDPVIFCDSK